MLWKSDLMTLTRTSEQIQVRVCEAKARSLSEITLTLSPGATLRDALEQARTHAGFGMLIDEAVAVGVFGKKLELEATLFHPVFAQYAPQIAEIAAAEWGQVMALTLPLIASDCSPHQLFL